MSERASLPAPVRNPWMRLAMLGIVILVALGFVAGCVAWLVPLRTGPSSATIELDRLVENAPLYYRPFNMGYDPRGAPLGMWLVRDEFDDVVALFSRDPHQGCSVDFKVLDGAAEGPGFRGPCTGSAFLIDGTRVFGPAPRGLDRFATELDGDIVRIDVTEAILGTCSPGVVVAEGEEIACSVPGDRVTERMSWPGD